MKRLLRLAATAFTTLAVAGDKPRPQTPVAESFQETMLLRMGVNDFYAAPTQDAARRIRSRWQDVPADVRRRIESRHPGTELRLLNLESEIEAAPPDGKPESNTVSQAASPAAPSANSDIWAKPNSPPPATAVAPPTAPWTTDRDPPPRASPRRYEAPVQFSDELDIFGNRPRPTPRSARPQ